MSHQSRKLLNFATAGPSANQESPPGSSQQTPQAVDSDFIVILAALLCALICVLGLIAVARCAWLRRQPPPAPPNKGLKKKVLRSLPKLTVSSVADLPPKLADVPCLICLSDFVPGDEIRVLPQCGHAFHLSCVDTWLGSHSSCPSCRQILASATTGSGSTAAAATRCQRCGGGLPADGEGAGRASEGGGGVGDRAVTFLP